MTNFLNARAKYAFRDIAFSTKFTVEQINPNEISISKNNLVEGGEFLCNHPSDKDVFFRAVFVTTNNLDLHRDMQNLRFFGRSGHCISYKDDRDRAFRLIGIEETGNGSFIAEGVFITNKFNTDTMTVMNDDDEPLVIEIKKDSDGFYSALLEKGWYDGESICACPDIFYLSDDMLGVLKIEKEAKENNVDFPKYKRLYAGSFRHVDGYRLGMNENENGNEIYLGSYDFDPRPEIAFWSVATVGRNDKMSFPFNNLKTRDIKFNTRYWVLVDGQIAFNTLPTQKKPHPDEYGFGTYWEMGRQCHLLRVKFVLV